MDEDRSLLDLEAEELGWPPFDDEPEDTYDPMDDIPWGTPDEWIPDNPDENGMRMSDFI